MPNLNSKRFTEPDALRRIKRECLLQWLAPARQYFSRRAAEIPEAASADEIDYGRLAAVFIEPEADMPEYLVNSIYLTHEMAEPNGMDALLEAAEESGLTLDVGDDPDPADVAVQVWLSRPDLLEQLHNEHQLTRPRSFVYFSTDATPVPEFTPPTPEQLTALEARLDLWFAKKKRGRGCRVFAYPKDGECWFLVRHGQPCKREGALRDGQPESVFYRPQRHDVLVYDCAEGEIRMNCCGKREMDEFLKAFGAHIFGRESFFPGTAKYQLAPLLTGRDCLACGDIEGMESVTLKEVEIFYGGKPWQRIVRKSEDIFALVEAELFRWPDADRLSRAGFEVKFADAKKTRRVTLIGSNKAQYGRDNDSEMVERWLKARGFILPKDQNEDE